jgi:hypothetical protein
MLLLILFPVISVTDDFWAAQNPAEADTCVRRNDVTAYAHTIVPEIAMPELAQTADSLIAFLGYAPVGNSTVPKPQILLRSTLFTRPPPEI